MHTSKQVTASRQIGQTGQDGLIRTKLKIPQKKSHNKTSENNAYSKFQQPSNPVAGAEGGIGSGDIEYEDNNMYESLSDDKQQYRED